MKEQEISQNLANAETLKSVIRDTIDLVCEKQNSRYPNICKLAHRSQDVREKIADNVFDLMTGDVVKLELDQAIGQVEGEIGSWGE